jgi:hypothetical protein
MTKLTCTVGGHDFHTSFEVLTKVEGSYFHTALTKDWNPHSSAVLEIARNDTQFQYGYLRYGYLPRDASGRCDIAREGLEELRVEADFYGLPQLVQEIDLLLKFNVKGMRYFISTFNLDSGPDSGSVNLAEYRTYEEALAVYTSVKKGYKKPKGSNDADTGDQDDCCKDDADHDDGDADGDRDYGAEVNQDGDNDSGSCDDGDSAAHGDADQDGEADDDGNESGEGDDGGHPCSEGYDDGDNKHSDDDPDHDDGSDDGDREEDGGGGDSEYGDENQQVVVREHTNKKTGEVNFEVFEDYGWLRPGGTQLLCIPLTEHVAKDGTLYDCTLRTVPDHRWYN